MAETYVKEVSKYKEDVKKEAENLLLRSVPSTILQLNVLLKTPKFRKREFGDMREYLNKTTLTSEFDLDYGDTSAPPAKRVKYDLQLRPGVLKSNNYLTDIIETVKPHLIKLIEDVNTLKMWIRYLIPKRENGNNFGVAIQEEVLDLIQKIQNKSVNFYERMFDYYNARAKILKAAIKHPAAEDYKIVVQELDEKEYLGFCFIMVEIRNNYCGVYDVFMKNLEKLKKPRSEEALESLY